jgi:hypothetical protein
MLKEPGADLYTAGFAWHVRTHVDEGYAEMFRSEEADRIDAPG